MGILLMFITSCKNGANTPTDLIPILTTATPTDITHNTVTCGGNITSDGGSDVTTRGVCWSTSPNPTTADNKTIDAAGTGAFTSSITGLNQATTYNVRAYATNKSGTAYGLQFVFTTQTVVTDIEGNIYHTLKIGNQTWMVENLKTTKYRNGDLIPNVTDATIWTNSTTGNYCNYNNLVDNATKYGRLYNWYAVSDSRNLAPSGWHVSTVAEWTTLENYLIANGYNYDGSTTGNNIAKSLAATTDWSTYPTIGTIGNDLSKNNKSGFTSLPGGYRINNGSFANMGYHAYWWTSTESSSSNAIFVYLHYMKSILYVDYPNAKNWGSYVRCVKD